MTTEVEPKPVTFEDLIKPAKGRVVVIPHSPDQVSKGGIILPDIAQEKQAIGNVVAMGPTDIDPPPCKVGDTVWYGKYDGGETKFGDTPLKWIKDENVIAVLVSREELAAKAATEKISHERNRKPKAH